MKSRAFIALTVLAVIVTIIGLMIPNSSYNTQSTQEYRWTVSEGKR